MFVIVMTFWCWIGTLYGLQRYLGVDASRGALPWVALAVWFVVWCLIEARARARRAHA